MIRSIAAVSLVATTLACAAVNPPEAASELWLPVRDPAPSATRAASQPLSTAAEAARDERAAEHSTGGPSCSTWLDADSASTSDASTPSTASSASTLDSDWSDFVAQGRSPVGPQATPPPKRPTWKRGQALMQGFFGAQFETNVERNGGTTPDVEDDDTILPVIGGGGQWKLSGDKVDFGLEAMISFAWQANATAVAVGTGGAAVAVDFGLLVIDLYGGPFLSMFLGNSARVYVAAGPLFEFANYDQDSIGGVHGSGSGFGFGGYARTGIEFFLSRGTMLGMGVRWSKSQVDLSNNLGDLDLEGLQAVITVTNGF
jgi:hypothetical protein